MCTINIACVHVAEASTEADDTTPLRCMEKANLRICRNVLQNKLITRQPVACINIPALLYFFVRSAELQKSKHNRISAGSYSPAFLQTIETARVRSKTRSRMTPWPG